jgi:hypothetical protein
MAKLLYQSDLSLEDKYEINEYIKIFLDCNFTKHHEVNQYITRTEQWNKFPSIRSLNDHGKKTEIPGILPNIFAIICKELKIKGDGGTPLDKAKHY